MVPFSLLQVILSIRDPRRVGLSLRVIDVTWSGLVGESIRPQRWETAAVAPALRTGKNTRTRGGGGMVEKMTMS